MLISESWLREWVSPDLNTAELSELLTMAGLEVETVTPVTPLGKLVVVGEVVSINKHADADKLNICEVDVGAKTNLTIVCGAANAAKGIKAPVALVGARLPNGMAIEDREVRGVSSTGMICAAAELGLEEQSSGLMLLEADAPVGSTLDDYLNLDDSCIEIDLTPDRGDCLSVAGVAREVSVLTGAALNSVEWVDAKQTHDQEIAIQLSAPAACARYTGRVIRNVNLNVSSPDWMKEKLRRGGIRSISPIVDVTNYVMLELGQPTHAFDYNKIEGNINVRYAVEGETLQLLDQKELSLNPDMLVIADDKKAIALGGIMGGANSEIDASTTDILLEVAYFSPEGIAGKARSLGMQTDASHRYERGVDSGLQKRASERATQLLLDIVGGEAGPICEAVNEAHMPSFPAIKLRSSRVLKMLGLKVEDDVIETNLKNLGFTVITDPTLDVTDEGVSWLVTAPSWRFDISGEHDLVEEVGRTVSFDLVPPALPQLRGEPHVEHEHEVSPHTLRAWVASADYHEVISYSFVDPTDQQRLHPSVDSITVGNPIAANMAEMRVSLWTGLVTTAQTNINRQIKRIRLFEVGHVFEPDASFDTGAKEIGKIAFLLSGPTSPFGWSNQKESVDFYDLKGDVENLFERVGKLHQLSFESAEHEALHPGQSAVIRYAGEAVGWLGQLHPNLVTAFDLNQAVYVAEVDIDILSTRELPSFAPISRFPASTRDLSLLVGKSVLASDILENIQIKGGKLLKKVELFDNYEGDKVGDDSKSLAFSLTFQSQDDSLSADHVDSLVEELLSHLQQTFGASLRV